ncbi:MAG TPA: sugar ABC transporter permease [Chloroflexia bacterium]|nr:sugar ABC transporter permease [Chloroflexia bacterium]
MAQTDQIRSDKATTPSPGAWSPSRFLIGVLSLVVVLIIFFLGFIYLKSSDQPQVFNAVVAIVWGVGAVAAFFTAANAIVESFSTRWRNRIQPYVFVGPGIALLTWFLVIPAARTFVQSFYGPSTTDFVGLSNYAAVFTDRQMLESFRNNLMWLILGTALCVILGLLIAVLADRSRFEKVAKALIFMPMAISFVGASVIWRFMYAYAPAEQPQIGLLNAIAVAFGLSPQSWITQEPWNNFFLIVVLVWMQTGFSMVLFSAALKGVPSDLLEAARVDGATEVQTFFSIIIPYIQGTIITVTTTVAIFTLKIFDVVFVMTGGQFGTEVVSTKFFREFFQNRNFGYGAAIAIVLFVCVTPVMIYNLRQLRHTEGF